MISEVIENLSLRELLKLKFKDASNPHDQIQEIEEMTTRIEAEALGLLDRIEGMGGTLRAIETGFIQQQIQDAAYASQQAVDRGDSIVVGVNRFQDTSERHVDVLRIDADVERRQQERVRQLRATRNDADCRAALGAVDAAARNGDNLVLPIIAAVEARATLGEVADTVARALGRSTPGSA